MKTLLAVYPIFNTTISSTEIGLLLFILALLFILFIQTLGFMSRLSGITEDAATYIKLKDVSIGILEENAKGDKSAYALLKKEEERLEASIVHLRAELKDLKTVRPMKNEDGRWIDGKTGQFIKTPDGEA
jgi:hypothetical protein